MDESGEKHAFIQVLNGKKKTSEYYKFPASSFQPDHKSFQLQIENNFFSETKLKLDLPDLKGELELTDPVKWPSSWYSPGIMGPFSFVPFMQCYHGILSLNHNLKGGFSLANQPLDFTGGKGYLEKDWGHSFPSAYIWMQSNHFSEDNISVKASVAKIPWLGSSFVGFIAGVYLKDRIIQFTTYNFTKLRHATADKKEVRIVMQNQRYRLEILAERDEATELAAPIQGFMNGRIEETMNARLNVKLVHRKSGKTILEDTGINAGLEVAGTITEITCLEKKAK